MYGCKKLIVHFEYINDSRFEQIVDLSRLKEDGLVVFIERNREVKDQKDFEVNNVVVVEVIRGFGKNKTKFWTWEEGVI